MKIRIMSREIESLKMCLDGKRRIMTYGAGSLANDIKKLLEGYGYKLDYAIVDVQYCDGNTYMDRYGGATTVTSIENLSPSYDPQIDVFVWAIGSPEKLRRCMEDRKMSIECFLIWDMGFWKDKNYLSTHKQEFQEVSELLCDEYSKKVFWGYLEAQEGNIDSDIRYCTNGVYFNELTKKKRTGAFLDCGSYDGESAIAYMKFIGEERQVFAFEPDKENFRNLVDKMENKSNVICMNKGCYSSEKQLSFVSNGDVSSSLQEYGNDIVEVTKIDTVVGEEKVAFIKMDVEGAELEALKGAKNVIERDMPILTISAYHKQEDLITLIPYIHKLCNKNEKYQLYLRHHSVVQSELVIYAIPEDDSFI
jgi:FkbM family methyltransferase